MMTLRQTYDVCKRGYRYDIEHDRFISDKEDIENYLEQYAPARIKIAKVVAQTFNTLRQYLKDHPSVKDEIFKKGST